MSRIHLVPFLPSSSLICLLTDLKGSSSASEMATTAAAFAPATWTSAFASSSSKTLKKTNKVVYLNGLNSFGGLKAQNKVTSLGQQASTEQCFANFVSSVKGKGGRGGGGGGALSATCNAASEIFKIAAIMNGLVIVGVAVGFILLRIEASLEDSE